MAHFKNVLSLFDGKSCGQIALNRGGHTYEKYYASEIDKYAISITQKNYPATVQLGDVTNWREWLDKLDFSKIDLVTGGFPCQALSLAGKQNGDKDPRGMLFWVMLDIVKYIKSKNPDVIFLLENVKMKKDFEDYITFHTEEALGKVNKYLINSALVSAQTRKRFYWTNIANVTQPKDKEIYLYQVLEEGFTDRDKSHCLTANYSNGVSIKQYAKSRGQLIFNKPIQINPSRESGGVQPCMQNRVYDIAGKSPCLTANFAGRTKILCGAFRGRYVIDGIRQDGKMLTAGLTEQRLEIREDGKTNTLTTVQKDNVVCLVEDDNTYYRKLTPLECERLQTVPDNYTEGVSNTQRYKMIGNGWTVDVIVHIYNFIDLAELW